MAQLTPEKEATLARLNAEAATAHRAESEKAALQGKPQPPAPAPLTPAQMEYPKWLFHPTEKPTLVPDEAAHKALGSGWAESPADAKKPEHKPVTPEKVTHDKKSER